MADGAVSIQAGDESGKLQVRHHHEVYNVDSAQAIPITGIWEGEGAQSGGLDMETPISVSRAGNVWLSLSDVSIQTGTQHGTVIRKQQRDLLFLALAAPVICAGGNFCV